MIVCDTNVISELMNSRPEPAVLDWIEGLPVALAVTAVTVQEIHFGLGVMPPGRRRTGLEDVWSTLLLDLVGTNVLPLSHWAGREAGEILARCQLAGRRGTPADAQIAAICLDYSLPLATRNTRDFELVQGLELINPFRP